MIHGLPITAAVSEVLALLELSLLKGAAHTGVAVQRKAMQSRSAHRSGSVETWGLEQLVKGLWLSRVTQTRALRHLDEPEHPPQGAY